MDHNNTTPSKRKAHSTPSRHPKRIQQLPSLVTNNSTGTKKESVLPTTPKSPSVPWNSKKEEGTELERLFSQFYNTNGTSGLDPTSSTKEILQPIWESESHWYRFPYSKFAQNYRRIGKNFKLQKEKEEQKRLVAQQKDGARSKLL